MTENLHCSAKNKHVAANAYDLHFESGREQWEGGASRTQLSIYGGFAVASAVTGLDGSGIHRICIAMGLTHVGGDLEELATGIAIDGVKIYPSLNNTLAYARVAAEITSSGAHVGRRGSLHWHADGHGYNGNGNFTFSFQKRKNSSDATYEVRMFSDLSLDFASGSLLSIRT